MDRVLKQLVDYLQGNTVAPNSVISEPFDSRLFVVGTMRDFSEVVNSQFGVQTLFRLVGNNPNPKWLRDFYSVTIQTIGKNRSKYVEAENLIHDIFNVLHGSENLIFDDSAYFLFKYDEGPRFISYLENSMPLFTSNLQFYVDGLVDKNNRKTLA